MLQDFLQPPTDDLGTAGVLSMHFSGQMYRARIDEQKGQTIPLGDSGVSVEIVDYYADAKPMPDGRKFVARSDKPRNPVLELRVHLPGATGTDPAIGVCQGPVVESGRRLRDAFVPSSSGITMRTFLRRPALSSCRRRAGKLYCRQRRRGIVG